MKKILLFLFVIKIALPLSAQDVPEEISQKMHSIFASASGIEWDPLSEGRYRANFTHDGIDKNALFSKSGNLLQLIFAVAAKDFPTDVQDALLKKFAGYEILEALRVEMSQDVTFKIKIKKGSDVYEVVIDIFGRVKRQVKLESTEEIAVCQNEDSDSYCERHGKKHKVKHEKKEKHKKGRGYEMSAL